MNRKIGLAFPLLIVLSTLAVFCFPAKSSPATIWVPDQYPTIQAAVTASNNGDTVRVRAGTYDEDVIINGKSISLVGDGASNTTIRGLGRPG